HAAGDRMATQKIGSGTSRPEPSSILTRLDEGFPPTPVVPGTRRLSLENQAQRSTYRSDAADWNTQYPEFPVAKKCPLSARVSRAAERGYRITLSGLCTLPNIFQSSILNHWLAIDTAESQQHQSSLGRSLVRILYLN